MFFNFGSFLRAYSLKKNQIRKQEEPDRKSIYMYIFEENSGFRIKNLKLRGK
jgi:hypothetical protein